MPTNTQMSVKFRNFTELYIREFLRPFAIQNSKCRNLHKLFPLILIDFCYFEFIKSYEINRERVYFMKWLYYYSGNRSKVFNRLN